MIFFRDIEKAVKKCWDLEHQWLNILNEKTGTKSDDYNQISSEFQSSLRNIEWDLEDLDETINILFKTNFIGGISYSLGYRFFSYALIIYKRLMC